MPIAAPSSDRPAANIASRLFTTALFLCLAALAVVHFVLIRKYSVDIPNWDEWDQLRSYALPHPSLRWVISQHNEHRIVWTKLTNLALLHIDGWNLRDLIAINFGIYLAIAGALYSLKRVTLGNGALLLWSLLFVPWLSTSANENLFWGFQNGFHFVLLFVILAVVVLFSARTTAGLCFGALLLCAAQFSFASGVPGTLAVTLVFIVSTVGEAATVDGTRGVKRALGRLGLPLTIVAASTVLWFQGFARPAYLPPLVLPTSRGFWICLSHLVARSFGFRGANDALVSEVVGGATMIALARLWWVAELRWSRALWAWLALGMGILAMLCTVSMGRAGFGVDLPVASRYAEIAMVLIYPTAVISYLAVRSIVGTKAELAPLIVLVVLFFGYRGDYDFQIYAPIKAVREASVDCARRFFAGQNPSGNCPTAYPRPIADVLQQAKDLHLSFTRGM